MAVVGAATPSGARLREALASFGLPGSRVDLYGTTRGEVVLSEYAGEARLIQEPDVGEISRRDLVFLCERDLPVERFVDLASRGTVLIDLVQAIPLEARPLLAHVEVNREMLREHAGLLGVPHLLTLLLLDLLLPLERSVGLERVVALIARPASDFGEEGIEELRQQTVSLLNFGAVPSAVFGRQLAFNLIPQHRPQLEHRVVREIGKLLGWTRNRLALRTLAVPVFYGHGVQLSLRPTRGSAAEVRAALESAGFELAAGERPTTPMDVSAERTTLLADCADDGVAGVWLWAVVGEAEARRAELAVRLGDELCDL